MSKNSSRNILNSISEFSGLPINMLGNSPIFHMYSDNEIIIEGAKSIEHYDEENVRILINKTHITICGKNMCIKCLINRNLSVSGMITGISIEHSL